jgi:hypothetical protein
MFSNWDFTYGGGPAREAMMGQLRWSAGLLDANRVAGQRFGVAANGGQLTITTVNRIEVAAEREPRPTHGRAFH